jgi:hypothetical protein
MSTASPFAPRPAFRARAFALGGWMLLALATLEPGAARASADANELDLSVFAGRWSAIELESAESDRFTAIDRAIGKLSWILRKAAAGVLRRSTRPPLEIQFDWDGNHLTQRILETDRERTRRIDLGPPEASPSKDTDPRTLGWSWTESGLRLNWQEARAYGSNFYRVDEARQTLWVEHRIHITAVDDVEPIVFRAPFGRLDRSPAGGAPPRIAAEAPRGP